MFESAMLAMSITLTRMRRLTGQTISMILGIALIIAILFSIIVFTNIIRVNLMLSAFDSIYTDINIQFITDNSSISTMDDVKAVIMENNYANAVIVKMFANNEVFSKKISLRNESGLSLRDNNSIIGLFGFTNEDLSLLVANIPQSTNDRISEQISLEYNEIIISNTTANKIETRTGENCVIELTDYTNQSIENYSVKIAETWNLTSSNDLFNEITRIPSKVFDGEQITDFIILNKQTYINVLKSFYTDLNNNTILSNGILSISVNYPSIIDRTNLTATVDRYNHVVDNISLIIETSTPSETVVIWENRLGEEIVDVLKQISESSSLFTLLGMSLIILLTAFFFILAQMKIDRSKHHFGMLLLRGSTITSNSCAFLFEGLLIGVLAGLAGFVFVFMLFIILTYMILPLTTYESIINFLDPNIFLPLMTGSIIIGLVLGLAGHSLIFLQLDGMIVKKLLFQSIEVESPDGWKNKGRWKYFFSISLITIITWAGWKFLYRFDIGGIWSIFLYIGEATLSILVLLSPIFLMLGLAGFIISKRRVVERIFTPLINPVLDNLTSLFFKGLWRKSKQVNKIVFVITSITVIAISSAIVTDTRDVIARKSITNEIGTDVQLSGNYQLLENQNFHEFLEENDHFISSTGQYSVYVGSFFAGYEGTGFCRVIAIENIVDFVNTIYTEIYSLEIQQELLDIMDLISDNNVIVPHTFYDSYDWNVGDVRKISLSITGIQSTVELKVAGYYQHFPVIALSRMPDVNILICSAEYLASQLNTSTNVNTKLLIRLNQDLPIQTKNQFIQLIKNTFHSLEVTVLEEKVKEYQTSIEGRMNIVFPIIFILVVLISAFGITWFIYAMFQDEKRELSIFQSRGIERLTILKIVTLRVLVIELVGIISGLSVSLITIILYTDLLIPQLVMYNYTIPITLIIQILALLVIMAIIHSIALIISLLNWTRSDIVSNLQFRS